MGEKPTKESTRLDMWLEHVPPANLGAVKAEVDHCDVRPHPIQIQSLRYGQYYDLAPPSPSCMCFTTTYVGNNALPKS